MNKTLSAAWLVFDKQAAKKASLERHLRGSAPRFRTCVAVFLWDDGTRITTKIACGYGGYAFMSERVDGDNLATWLQEFNFISFDESSTLSLLDSDAAAELHRTCVERYQRSPDYSIWTRIKMVLRCDLFSKHYKNNIAFVTEVLRDSIVKSRDFDFKTYDQLYDWLVESRSAKPLESPT